MEPRGTSLTGESDYSPSGVFACLFGLFLPIFKPNSSSQVTRFETENCLLEASCVYLAEYQNFRELRSPIDQWELLKKT